MILAKLSEQAMCRISGEEEVKKLGGLQPPEPPCFLRQCSDWKIAGIVPVPKGADQTQASGYRPISILLVVSKIIEQHIKLLLETHLQNYAPTSSSHR